ncbi:unnamed protein product [Caenorhabditis angaria]|uniref:CHK kinase-like domain-containing protein n=1 Tax=Caenorhabditis angaria TaxID=860376 RepID=A0A9P1N263_9PELO|nr:unnamed protein product [Caenorhabditis angaria]
MYRVWKPQYEIELANQKMLHVPTDGLLGSNFSWEDVERTIGDDFKFGERKTIEPLGVGVGLQSLLGVIHSDSKSSKVPETFVLKIGSPIALLQALSDQAAKVPPEAAAELVKEFVSFLPPCHNSEIYFYEKFQALPIAHSLSQIPQYFFGEKLEALEGGDYTKGCIGIEYIENVYSLSPAQNFSDEQVKQVLKVLAKLEVGFLKVSENESEQQTPHDGFAGLYKTFKDWFLQMNNQLLGNVPPLAQFAQQFTEILPEIITCEEVDKLSTALGIKKVLVHGDLWAANIMWNSETNNLEKIVDFQMIHFGLAATDLTRFFNTCLSAEDRKLKWREYLKYFHDSLVEEVDDQELPYTYEQLELSYRLVYPRSSAQLLPPLSAILENVSKLPDDEVKQAALGTVISKIAGIYADIIEEHKNRPKI